jgi:2-iminobutanoate/2-iminopropanoate deaminase
MIGIRSRILAALLLRARRRGGARGGPGKGDHADFKAQMRQVMENLKAILEAAGSSLDKVVKVNVILVRISDFAAMNEIYKEYFKEGTYPARTTIEAKLAGQDFLLEIECVAEA